jgi:hypothetical protein
VTSQSMLGNTASMTARTVSFGTTTLRPDAQALATGAWSDGARAERYRVAAGRADERRLRSIRGWAPQTY